MASRKTSRTDSRKKNRKYGDLVKTVAKASARSSATVYRVLRGEVKSRPVQDAIDAYHRGIGSMSMPTLGGAE